jgi:NAD(P)-dependent dehydrogenase (short-subunit alcohol dehydrogenase family)
MSPTNPFDLSGRTAVVTGGTGVLGGAMASALAAAGVRVALLSRTRASGDAKAAELRAAGGDAIALEADVLDEGALRAARDELLRTWDRLDILVNAAGGNVAKARTDVTPVWEVPREAYEQVIDLNLHGTVVPSMIFGEVMARQKRGSIVNISSMAATQAMSGVPGYSIAKAGIDVFTKWLAMEMARKYGDGVRVNAIAPGFFITHQNRAVLVKEDGSYTERAQNVLRKTPMGRFGAPEEVTGAVHWLCSDAASFVTGAVIPIDGGFSTFSGV